MAEFDFGAFLRQKRVQDAMNADDPSYNPDDATHWIKSATKMLGPYDTKLSADEEPGFKSFKDRYAPQDSGEDYDLRGAYKAGVTPDINTGHMPDTFKKPNHPTFSDESQYAPMARSQAGHWQGDTYVPPEVRSNSSFTMRAPEEVIAPEQSRAPVAQPQVESNTDNIANRQLMVPPSSYNKVLNRGSSTYDHPKFPGTLESPNNLPKTDVYAKTIEEQPNIGDYHPSKLRQIMAGIAGAGIGMTDAKAGAQASEAVRNQPYNRKLAAYEQKAKTAKTASDLEVDRVKLPYEMRGKYAQGESDLGSAEYNRKRATEYVPETKEDVLDLEAGKLESGIKTTTHEIKTKDGKTIWVQRHPNGSLTSLHDNTPISYDAIAPGMISDAGKSLRDTHNQDLTGTLKEMTVAQQIVDDYNKNPDPNNLGKYTAAQAYLDKQQKENPGSSFNQIVDARNKERALKKLPPMDSKELEKLWQERPAPQQMIVNPENNQFQVARPGAPAPKGFQTLAGANTSNTATSTTRTMRETAPQVINLATQVNQLVDQQVKTLGPAASRWNEFMSGAVGAPNPEFTKLRTNAALLQTLLMRMHVGASGRVAMMESFKDLMDSGKQSPENLKAAIGEIINYAKQIQSEGDQDSSTLPDGITMEEIQAEKARRKGAKK